MSIEIVAWKKWLRVKLRLLRKGRQRFEAAGSRFSYSRRREERWASGNTFKGKYSGVNWTSMRGSRILRVGKHRGTTMIYCSLIFRRRMVDSLLLVRYNTLQWADPISFRLKIEIISWPTKTNIRHCTILQDTVSVKLSPVVHYSLARFSIGVSKSNRLIHLHGCIELIGPMKKY